MRDRERGERVEKRRRRIGINFPKQADAKRMKGGDPKIGRTGDKVSKSVPHFLRSLVGKRNRQNPIRQDSFFLN